MEIVPTVDIFEVNPEIDYNYDSDQIKKNVLSELFPHTKDYSERQKQIAINVAAERLVNLVRQGSIWFPFYWKYLLNNPDTLFDALEYVRMYIVNPRSDHEYYPLYRSYYPFQFRGKSMRVIENFNDEVDRSIRLEIERLTDYFTEDVRLKARRYDKTSVLDCWNNDECLKRKMMSYLKWNDPIYPHNLRKGFLSKEVEQFYPEWTIIILKLIAGPFISGKVLDISAGFGGRLLGIISLEMDYLGYDPNIELMVGYNEIINLYGDPNHHRIIYEPFETANIPDELYDFVFASPPLFDYEIYSDDPTQSIKRYPEFNTWMVQFLFASLTKAWDHLKDDGYLILNLHDVASFPKSGNNKILRLAEATNIFIENYLAGSSWEGVFPIGLWQTNLIWIWKKVSSPNRTVWVYNPDLLEEQTTTELNAYTTSPEAYYHYPLPIGGPPLSYSQRTLYHTYPELHAELLRFFVAKYVPNYAINRSNAVNIRAYLPGSNFDDLLITSLLEAYQSIENTLNILRQLLPYSQDVIISEVGRVVPQYLTKLNNSINTRAHVALQFPTVDPTTINDILSDDLMINSLLDVLQIENTIKWCIAMVKLALRI